MCVGACGVSVRRLRFVVCFFFSGVFYVSFVDYCCLIMLLLFVVRCSRLLFGVCCLMFVVRCVLFVVCLSGVCSLWFVV